MQYDPQLELIFRDEETHEEWVDTHFYSQEQPTDASEAMTKEAPSVEMKEDEDDDDDVSYTFGR
jgi:hypothetical protein